MRSAWSIFGLCLGAILLLHCNGFVRPPGGTSSNACLEQNDCSLGRVCQLGVCVIGDDQMLDPPRQVGPPPDVDVDKRDAAPADVVSPGDDPLKFQDDNTNGRGADAMPSPDQALKESDVGELLTGRDGGTTPRPPPPRREVPDTAESDSEKDDPKAIRPQCQQGQSRPCYPEKTKGCHWDQNNLRFKCIAPCQPGKQVCTGGQWETTCQGAKVPADKDQCTLPPQGIDCPPEKIGPDGRCTD